MWDWHNRDPEKARAASRRYYAAHREKVLVAGKRYKIAHARECKAVNRLRTIERQYGLTLDQYHALLERQGEHCAICSTALIPLGRDTHIDHDHCTTRVRGLLCGQCNPGLGRFKDDPATLRRAAEYLERAA